MLPVADDLSQFISEIRAVLELPVMMWHVTVFGETRMSTARPVYDLTHTWLQLHGSLVLATVPK